LFGVVDQLAGATGGDDDDDDRIETTASLVVVLVETLPGKVKYVRKQLFRIK